MKPAPVVGVVVVLSGCLLLAGVLWALPRSVLPFLAALALGWRMWRRRPWAKGKA